jgi:hypothetical protein
MRDYCKEVRSGVFPDDKEYCYPMIEGEEKKFIEKMKL